VDDAEERADIAENSLSKLRAKNRTSASLAPSGSSGLAKSTSRARASASALNFD